MQHLLRHLFGGAAGAEAGRRIDRKIHALPGLAGLNLVARTLAKRNLGAAAA